MTDNSGEPAAEIGAAEAVVLVERYISAGEHAKARIVLDKLLLAAGQGGDVLPDPAENSLNGGLAYIYAKLNRAELSTDYAQLALLCDPTDRIAHTLLTEEQKIHLARGLMHHRRAESATAIFKLMDETGSQEAASYLSLMAYFDGLRTEIAALPEDAATTPRPLIMNIVVWGASYVESLLTYTFPSLMAGGNIPYLTRGRTVVLDLFTTETDRDAIQDSAAGKAVMARATLRFNIIPDTLLSVLKEKTVFNFDRWLIAGAQQCSALRAKRIGADLTFISSAAVYSANCFAAAAGFIDDGYQAVLTCPPRTVEPALLSHLAQYADISGGVIAIDEEALTRFIVDNLHPHCRDCFIATPHKTVYQNPVTLFFKTRSGFSSRSYQLSPMLISHCLLGSDFSFDYLTVDARFIAELMRGKSPDGLLKVILNPSAELVVTDVDTESGSGMKTYGGIPATVDASATAALATALRQSDLPFFEWALRQRFEYKAKGDLSGLPDSGLDEDETIDNLISLIRQQSESVRKTLQIYDTAPVLPAEGGGAFE